MPPDSAGMRCTLEQIAQHLGVNARTVRRYLEQGLVPGAKRTTGRHWRVPGTAPQVARLLAVKSGRQGRAFRRWMRSTKKQDVRVEAAEVVLAGFGVDQRRRQLRAILNDKRITRLVTSPQFERGLARDPDHWQLVAAAHLAVMVVGAPTAKAVAAAMCKSRSWLYAQYGAAAIRRAQEQLNKVQRHG